MLETLRKSLEGPGLVRSMFDDAPIGMAVAAPPDADASACREAAGALLERLAFETPLIDSSWLGRRRRESLRMRP